MSVSMTPGAVLVAVHDALPDLANDPEIQAAMHVHEVNPWTSVSATLTITSDRFRPVAP
jgi:hypothetical protein